MTAIKKVLYYLIDIINITNYICGNQQQRFKINYVTTDISAEQQNKASLFSCFVLCFFFPSVVLILSYLLQVRYSVQTPAAPRYRAASTSDTHDAPVSSSLYLWLYSSQMNYNSYV